MEPFANTTCFVKNIKYLRTKIIFAFLILFSMIFVQLPGNKSEAAPKNTTPESNLAANSFAPVGSISISEKVIAISGEAQLQEGFKVAGKIFEKSTQMFLEVT